MASNTYYPVPAYALVGARFIAPLTRVIAQGALGGGRGAARLVQSWRSWRSWGYAGDKRDLRLDLLRGFAAMTMIIDHIGGKDSWLYTISGGDRFFVSAAEGFVFISGLVMGIVYAALIARQGLRAALVKGAKRVATLYGLTVGLSLIFAGISFELELPWAPHIMAANIDDFVAGILTLHRAFYLTDVLLLYTLVVAVALPALALMWRGYGWLVLAGSWALWAAWQWWPDRVQLPWAITDSTVFHFSAWQVLFITGLVIGYHRKAWEHRLARVLRVRGWGAWPVQLAALVLSAALVGGSIAFYFWNQANPGNPIIGSQVAQVFGKADVRAGRLALFACLFVFAFLLSTLAWVPIKRLLGWLLLPMGQDALTVYTLHLFVIVLTAEAGPRMLGSVPYSTLDNTLVQVAAISIIWGAVMAKAKGKALMRFWILDFGFWTRGWGQIQNRKYKIQNSLSKPARLGFAALLLAGIAPISTGSVLASPRPVTLRNSPSANTASQAPSGYDASSLPVPSETAFPAPTGVASVSSVGASRSAATTSPLQEAPSSLSTPASAAPFATERSNAASGAPAGGTGGALPAYIENRTFLSVSINRVMPYYIYLPPGYDSNPNARYPVLYMLHGMSGTNDEWLSYGLLSRANEMMWAGQISQFIIVLPQGDQGYWMDHANGGPRWGTYVVRDVVNEIDANFRTLADPRHRAVGGLSMGGYGALQLAINYPDVFGGAGAHSPSLHDHATAPTYFGDQAYFDAHDPVYLYQTHPDVARMLKLWIDDGQQDDWLPVITSFHQLLESQSIPHEWQVFPGGHVGEYWSTHVPDYLRFYSSALSAVSHPIPAAPTTPTPTPVPPVPGTPAGAMPVSGKGTM